MTILKKYLLELIFAVAFVYLIYYSNELHRRRVESLKNSFVAIGEVEDFENTRGPRIVDVKFTYGDKILHNTFGTYNRDILDSLKIGTKVVLKVSKKEPERYIKYIGVYQPEDGQ